MSMLWNFNEGDTKIKIGRNEQLKKSGVYEVVIKEAYISYSTSSKAVGLTLSLECPQGYARTTLWYKKGDGEPNPFAELTLNRMLFLSKLKLENLKPVNKEVKGYDGSTFKRWFIEELAGKELGVILVIKKEGDKYNVEVKDFYDIKSGRTADEITNNKEATTVEFFREKFKTEEPQKLEEKKEGKENDEFPF